MNKTKPRAASPRLHLVLWTVQDVAARYGISVFRVHQRRNERSATLGRRIGRKIGTQWIFTPEEVEELRTKGPRGVEVAPKEPGA